MPKTQQLREEAERAAEEALSRFVNQHPEVRKTEIPAPLKWAGAIGAAVMTAMVAAFFVWLTSAVNNMQVTVARIDERQSGQMSLMSDQFESLRTRVSDLERYHREKGQ